jgi:hypoxanthine phosphoribosyltransferase
LTRANIKVLVVDDSIASGSAMIEVKESLKHLEDKFDLKYAIYVIPGKKKWLTTILRMFLYQGIFNGIF